MKKVLNRVLILSLLFSISLYAKEVKWHNLKKINLYKSGDYHLREDVIALEIRTYDDIDNYKKPAYIPVSVYAKPLNSIDKKLLKYFHDASPDFSRKGDIRKVPDLKGDKTRAFMLKKDNVVYRMNEISDVVHALGEIDRPAEAYLVWWISSKYSGIEDTKKWKFANSPVVKSMKYHQTLQGYEMIIKYIISRSYDKDYEYCTDSQIFTDKIIVDKNGQIVYFKQLNKSKVETGCSAMCILPPPPKPTGVAPKKNRPLPVRQDPIKPKEQNLLEKEIANESEF